MRAWPTISTRTRNVCGHHAVHASREKPTNSPSSELERVAEPALVYGEKQPHDSDLDNNQDEDGMAVPEARPHLTPPTQSTMRLQLIGHFEPCMTEIYLHIDARMADYMATHP